MKENISVINSLMVDVFNNILSIEENAFKDGLFNDVSIAEAHTIEAIGMYGTKSMSEVAKALDITVGTLTVAVNNLVKKQYVERFKSEYDRRVVKIGLTKKGRLAYRVHEKFHIELITECIEGLTEEEELILVKTFQKLNKFLKYKYFSRGEKQCISQK